MIFFFLKEQTLTYDDDVYVVSQFALVATHAALLPEMYWKSKLPSTQMPKTITDLLHLGLYSCTIHIIYVNHIFQLIYKYKC